MNVLSAEATNRSLPDQCTYDMQVWKAGGGDKRKIFNQLTVNIVYRVQVSINHSGMLGRGFRSRLEVSPRLK